MSSEFAFSVTVGLDRLEDITEIGLSRNKVGGVQWIHLTWDGDCWWALMNVLVMSLCVP